VPGGQAHVRAVSERNGTPKETAVTAASPDAMPDAMEEQGAATERGPHEDQAARAGRGVLSMTASKLYFIVAGYAVQLLLPRLLGSPEAFGLFSTAMSFVSILNNVLITATIQVVSKRVSEDRTRAGGTLRQGLELQLLVGAVIAGSLFSLSGLLSRDVMLDPTLRPLLQLSSVVVLAYALYAALIGAQNGLQNFLLQAKFDMTYTTLRSGLMLLAAGLGLGAVGAFAGFAAAAVGVLAVGLLVIGTGERASQRSPLRVWITLMAPLWLYQLCLNLILQIDVTLLKRTVAELALAAGQTAEVAAETASRHVGFYRAAQTFAFVPYQLILSVAFVIFPMMSEAASLGDAETMRRYIRGALRFSLLVLLAIAAPVSGAAEGVMHIVYPGAYLAGSVALSVLALGMVCFALFVIAATIMSGAGRPGLAATIALISGLIVIVGNLVLVRASSLGDGALVAAASATSFGTVFALLAMGTAVYLRFGAFIPWPTALRALTAALVAGAVARLCPSTSKLSSLVALAGGFGSYVLTLFVVRELGKPELDALLRIVRRRR
jgi:stage V sporulation protein B